MSYCIRLDGKLIEGAIPSVAQAREMVLDMKERRVRGEISIDLFNPEEKPFYQKPQYTRGVYRAYETGSGKSKKAFKKRLLYVCETPLCPHPTGKEGGLCAACTKEAAKKRRSA